MAVLWTVQRKFWSRHAKVPIKSYVVATGMGIERNHDFTRSKEEVDHVKDAVKNACDGKQVETQVADTGSSRDFRFILNIW